eukprot:TRINITY_DN894_c0_g1_i1.p1 TRINITY_DN894_c0_g1~~TRINITY_DN894_c0_g1_i1.p1  ORF type:complete len:274 (+),score=29.93 TRINITY_DN894_c0_g1_i1:475-1296(+)
MLAATRVTETNLTLSCPWTLPNCSFNTSTLNYTFFVADIENFTLMIDHAIITLSLGVQKNANTLPGALLDLEGNEYKDLQPPNIVGQEGQYDIIELNLLLQAAGINSLDSDSGAENTKGSGETLRYAGLILMVIIDYSNTYSFDVNSIDYRISTRLINNTEFKSLENLYTNYPNQMIQRNRHGIRMIFLQTGFIGGFDFLVLLLNCVAGMGLLAVATVVVDILAFFLVPERDYYSKYKYDEEERPIRVPSVKSDPINVQQSGNKDFQPNQRLF